MGDFAKIVALAAERRGALDVLERALAETKSRTATGIDDDAGRAPHPGGDDPGHLQGAAWPPR